MVIILEITHRQGWIPNPDWIVSELSNKYIQLPNKYAFYLPNLTRLDYCGKHRGSFEHPKRLIMKCEIPICRVKNLELRTPSLKEQYQKHAETYRDHHIYIKTEPYI